jgi:protoporphyrinogen oxidase
MARAKNGSSYISSISEAAATRLIEAVTDEELLQYNEDRRAYFDKINRLTYLPEGTLLEVILTRALSYIESEIEFDECIQNMKTDWEPMR